MEVRESSLLRDQSQIAERANLKADTMLSTLKESLRNWRSRIKPPTVYLDAENETGWVWSDANGNVGRINLDEDSKEVPSITVIA